MKRRKLIALISLCTVVVLGIAGAITVFALMHSDVPRRLIEVRLAAAVNGSVHLGRISGNPFRGLTIDTVAIRDKSGDLVISTGRLTADYDVRDIIDSRVFLRHVTAEHPLVKIRQIGNTWNYKQLFKGSSGPRRPAATRSWRDFIVL